MPIPIRSGYNFDISHSKPLINDEMKAPEMCRDFYEIGFTIQGDRACITNNKVIIFHSGDVGVTNKNTFYKTTSLSDVPHEKILIKFRPEVVKPLIEVLGTETFEHFITCPIYHFNQENQEMIRKIFEEMYQEFLLDEPCSELLLKGHLYKLIITTLRLRTTATTEDLTIIKSAQPVMDAIYYIESNYHNDPTLATVAKRVNLTPFYFSKIFKDSTGITYSQYLNHVKHQHVRLLLAQTNLSIDEISEKCGFSSRNYMCNVFKQIDGRTPKEFRKEQL